MSDLDRYQYGYDQDSNRLWKANVLGTAAVSSGLDEFYAYDPLNRLSQMQDTEKGPSLILRKNKWGDTE